MQALLPRLCCTAATPYWQSPHHQPIPINDCPSQEEVALLSCPALNPLSAALLARLSIHGGGLSDELLSGRCTEQLVQQGVPRRSLHLLLEELQGIQAADATAAAGEGDGAGEVYDAPQWVTQQQKQQQLGHGPHQEAALGAGLNGCSGPHAALALEEAHIHTQQGRGLHETGGVGYTQKRQQQQWESSQLPPSGGGLYGHMDSRGAAGAAADHACPLGLQRDSLHAQMGSYSSEPGHGMPYDAAAAGHARYTQMGLYNSMPMRSQQQQQQQQEWYGSQQLAAGVPQAEEELPDIDWNVPGMHGSGPKEPVQPAYGLPKHHQQQEQQQHHGMYGAGEWQQRDNSSSRWQDQGSAPRVGVGEDLLETSLQDVGAPEGVAFDPGNVLEAYLAKRKRGAVPGLRQEPGGAKRSRPGARSRRGMGGAASQHNTGGIESLGVNAGAGGKSFLAGIEEDCIPGQLQQQGVDGGFTMGANPSSLHSRSRSHTAATAAGHLAGGMRSFADGAVAATAGFESSLPPAAAVGAAGDDCWQELDQVMGTAAGGGGRSRVTSWLEDPSSSTYKHRSGAEGGVCGGRGLCRQPTAGLVAPVYQEDIGGFAGQQSGLGAVGGSDFHRDGSGYMQDPAEAAALYQGEGVRYVHGGLGLHGMEQEGLAAGGWEDAMEYDDVQVGQYSDKPAWAGFSSGLGHRLGASGSSLLSNGYDDGSSLLGPSHLQQGGVSRGMLHEQQPAAAWGKRQEGNKGRSKMQLGYRATGTSKQTKLCWRQGNVRNF